MDRRLLLSAIVISMLVPSCRLFQQRVDFTWFGDTMAAPQRDDVYIETGKAASAPTWTASTAPVAAPAATGSASRRHTVVRGDTLGGIARRYNCSVAAIRSANRLANPNNLKLGTVLIIPGRQGTVATAPVSHGAAPQSPAASATRARAYAVRPGDTINAIARRYGVAPAALMRANRMSPAQAGRLRIGQQILIPSAKR